jgi:predicted DNA-binding protein with PD1-like motif
MKYVQTKVNRVYLLRFDHEDDVIKELSNLAVKESLGCGFIMLIGATSETEMVVGSSSLEVPPNPIKMALSEERELIGLGTLGWKDGKPIVHIHASLGKGSTVNVGCLRERCKVYLTVEGLIIEFGELTCVRKADRNLGVDVTHFVENRTSKVNRREKG